MNSPCHLWQGEGYGTCDDEAKRRRCETQGQKAIGQGGKLSVSS